jgi:beta-galactosidase
VYKLPGERLPYGSDRDILGTDYDAIYETQRVGLTQFRLDVPDGEYEVVLHFAELEAAPAGEQLVYNLASATAASGTAPKAGRAFSVLLNGVEALPDLNTTMSLLPLQAASFKVPVSARGGHGIVIDFKAQTGESILNGLQVKRL